MSQSYSAKKVLLRNSDGEYLIPFVETQIVNWGDVQGNLENQTDLKNALDLKADKTELSDTISNHNTSNEAHSDIRTLISDNSDDIAEINGKIPTQASTSNQLADKAFVNQSIQTASANYRGSWANWTAVPTDTNLYPEDYAGSKVPTVNDYLVIQDVSDYTTQTIEGTWRFKYTGDWNVNGKNGWEPEYQINETPFTDAQLQALNSNITATLTAQITLNQSAITSIEADVLDLQTNKADKSELPTVNNGILTIQRNGQAIDTFSANSASDKTINISVPTNNNQLTNGAGYITKEVDNLTNYTKTSDLSSVAFSGEYTDLLNTPTKLSDFQNDENFIDLTSISATDNISYDNSTGVISVADNYQIPTIEQVSQIALNKSSIETINSTLDTYGNIVTHDVSEFATSQQGALADTAIQPNDNISELNNDVGYISSVSWGDIQGTLSEQTDLQTSLDSKLDKKDLINYDLTKQDNYLYSIHYSKEQLNYNNALNFFEENYHNSPSSLNLNLGSCTSIKKNNIFGRNYDWYYSECASFVVKKESSAERFASIGMAGGLSSLTKEVVESAEWNNMYDILPFFLLDGINEHGVTVSVNVVPAGDKGRTTGTHPDKSGDNICMLMLPSYILDKFSTAQEAVNWIINDAKIYAPYNASVKEEMHFLIADNGNSFIVEFVDNVAKVIQTDKTYITNFYLDGVTFDQDNKVNANSVTNYGQGLERYNLITDNYNNIDSNIDMLDFLKSLNYTNAYHTDPISNWWKTDFSAPYADQGKSYPNLTVTSPVEDYVNSGLVTAIEQLFATRTRDGQSTWQTIHTSVYDIEKKQFILLTQEQNTYKTKTFHLFPNIGDGKLIITQDNQVIGEYNANQHLDTNINIDLSSKQNKLVAGTNITIDPITNIISASGGLAEVSWGGITGSLDNQQDLKTVLDSKATKTELEEGLATKQPTGDYATNTALTNHTSNTTIHVTSNDKNIWNNKQNAISDLTNIRDGASKGSTAVQPEDLADVATTGDYNDLINQPTIPSEVTEATVSGWGFTKNTGTYSKPASGIPKTDLSNGVQASLDKADSALQSVPSEYVTETELSNYHDSTKQDVITDLATIKSNAEAGKDASDTISGYGDIVTHNASEFQLAGDYVTNTQVASAISAHNIDETAHQDIRTLVSSETSDRESAVNNLQDQIDGIVASADVRDIVGTYADLQSYDKSTLGDKDIIKVLQDETKDGASTYYRFAFDTQSFNYIGEEGPYYTKSESESTFVPQTRTINGKALNTNISLDAEDVGALPSTTIIPTVNNGTLTVKVNESTQGTFTANQSADTSINISVPTKTSDITNDSDFITSSYHDNTKQNITDNTLTTTSKTIVGAINELNAKPSMPSLDGVTIDLNLSDELQAIGLIDKNSESPVYDWVGTKQEYEAQNIETLHPDWICFITDDFTEANSNSANSIEVQLLKQDIQTIQQNKVTVLNETCTNEQYPSAKCIYDILNELKTALEEL